MLKVSECYFVCCDNCKEQFEDPMTGFSFWIDHGTALDEAKNSDWLTDPKDEKDEKIYCPECAKLDEDIDDLLIIDASRFKEK